MDWRVRRDWIDALRSGKYKQARHRLKRVDEYGVARYCCLGVLAEEMGENTDTMMLPQRILDKVCLTETQQERLAKLNDSGLSFDYIADFIEDKTPDEMCD